MTHSGDMPAPAHRDEGAVAGAPLHPGPLSLASVAELLHRATRAVYARADADGPTSPLHSLGLGISLVHSHVRHRLRVVDHASQVPRSDGSPEPGDPDDPGENDGRRACDLLREAHDLFRLTTRSGLHPSAESPDLRSPSLLEAELRNLADEAQHYGC